MQQQGQQRQKGPIAAPTVTSTFAAIKQCAEGLFKQKTRDLTKLQLLTTQRQELEEKHSEVQSVLLTLKQHRSRGDAILDAQQARVAEREGLLKAGERQDAAIHDALQSLAQCSKATHVCQDVMQKLQDEIQKSDIVASMQRAEAELEGRDDLFLDMDAAEYARRCEVLEKAIEGLRAGDAAAALALAPSLATWAGEWDVCATAARFVRELQGAIDLHGADEPVDAPADRARLAALVDAADQALEIASAAAVSQASLDVCRNGALEQLGVATRLCEIATIHEHLTSTADSHRVSLHHLAVALDQLHAIDRELGEGVATTDAAISDVAAQEQDLRAATTALEVETATCSEVRWEHLRAAEQHVASLNALRVALQEASVDRTALTVAEAEELRRRLAETAAGIDVCRVHLEESIVERSRLQGLSGELGAWDAAVRQATLAIREALSDLEEPTSGSTEAPHNTPPLPAGGDDFVTAVDPVTDADAEQAVSLHLSIASAHARRQLEAIEKQISASVSRMLAAAP